MDEIVEAEVLGLPSGGELVSIETHAEKPEQWHDVPNDEKNENRSQQNRREKPALIQRPSERQSAARLGIGGRRCRRFDRIRCLCHRFSSEKSCSREVEESYGLQAITDRQVETQSHFSTPRL